MSRPPKAREPLKQAALQLFVENGVHATGIREISRHAGCSEAALYRHWANKDDLVRALFKEHLEEVVHLLTDALASTGTVEERLRAGCRAAYTLYDEQPLVFRFVLLVQHELATSLDTTLRMPQDIIQQFISDAVARGEAKGDPVLLTAGVMGIFLQTAEFVLYGRLQGPLSRYSDDVVRGSMKLLAG